MNHPLPSTAPDDERRWLAHAVGLAADNVSAGQLPFGAVVVRDGVVVATGVNTARRDLDPTAHAEIAAIRAACSQLRSVRLDGAVVYSSCQPCAMCQVTAAITGVLSIVHAATRDQVPDIGKVDDAGLGRRMQDAIASIRPSGVRHVPIADADLPFRRWTENSAR